MIKDEISYGLGIANLMCWSVAAIPQIITNFTNKSADGVSLAFLSTWIIGDICNLVGCILEPATLPTQFYTAVLYTTFTVILGLQCIYYNHCIQWRKQINIEANRVKDETLPLQDQIKMSNAPVEVSKIFGGSNTPPTQDYRNAMSGPPALQHRLDSSSEGEEEDKLNFPPQSVLTVSQPRSIPGPVRYGTFIAVSANLAHLGKSRKLLQEGIHENAYGQWLGWGMAALYMGGRFPQLCLNIKRGTVEGLNPLMFVFAIIGNATYVGSILVRNSEWKMIKANMPWVLDAVVCVLLDLFIIVQYIFYKYIKLNQTEDCGGYYGDYVEPKKPSS